MYNTLKKLILAGGYKYSDMKAKIQRLYVCGDLDEGEADSLLGLAVQFISGAGERPELIDIIQSLAARVEALEKAVAPEEDAGEEGFPEWQPWDGVSNKYQMGDVVSHNGKLWKSVFVGQNVWEPGLEEFDWLWEPYHAE